MKNIFFIVVVLIFFGFTNTVNEPLTTQVQVKQGRLQGTAEDGLLVFKGIPFAKPPVGDLRWRAPQPVKKWDGVLQVNKFAPGPIQGGNTPSGKSEDCLYLNVWTPAKSAKEK